MSDLRADLDAALRTARPGQPPIEATMRRGRRQRARRRVTAIAATIVVAVAVVIGYPAASHLVAGRAPAPPADQKPAVVTDMPPSPRAPEGEIAMGQVGTTAWQVSVDKPAGSGKAARPQCFEVAFDPGAAGKKDWDASTPIAGSVLDNGGSTSCNLQQAGRQDPLALQEAGNDSTYLMIASVTAQVRYLVVTLAGGQVIKAIPVAAYGQRFLAYAAPRGDPVLMASARLSGGKTLTAVPFTQPGGLPYFGLWAAPGQPVPPMATEVVGSGTANGQRWSLTAHEGPWGTCATWTSGPAGSATGCDDLERFTDLFDYWGGADSGGARPDVIGGSAPPVASRLEVTLTDGSRFQVPVTVVGNEKLWAFALEKGQVVKRLTAYNASGAPAGNGQCLSCSDR